MVKRTVFLPSFSHSGLISSLTVFHSLESAVR
jgi:hypothetical protein